VLAPRSQLEAEWHRTAPRTKQLVADVGVLRKLLDYLVRYDAFSFYYLLMKLQVASSEQASPSLWSVISLVYDSGFCVRSLNAGAIMFSMVRFHRLMSEAANQIFKKAKERVYRLVPVPASKSTSTKNPISSGKTMAVCSLCAQTIT